jgi:hypothetical protein
MKNNKLCIFLIFSFYSCKSIRKVCSRKRVLAPGKKAVKFRVIVRVSEFGCVINKKFAVSFQHVKRRVKGARGG